MNNIARTINNPEFEFAYEINSTETKSKWNLAMKVKNKKIKGIEIDEKIKHIRRR